jgi:hypothetical protein
MRPVNSIILAYDFAIAAAFVVRYSHQPLQQPRRVRWQVLGDDGKCLRHHTVALADEIECRQRRVTTRGSRNLIKSCTRVLSVSPRPFRR